VSTLHSFIEASVSGWDNPVERAVFGTDDPAAITKALERFCLAAFDASIAQALFYEASVGCVIGVLLQNRTVVVLKAYQQRWTAQFLTAVGSIQMHLSQAGFPCPRPGRGPLPLGSL
jgi:hypothetical protein